jgi:hypothetical protein
MPNSRDENKRSWHPSERDWALAREFASAREEDRDTVAWALLARMAGSEAGDAFYDDGHGIEEAVDDLWGIYGNTDELCMGAHGVSSMVDAGAVLELLTPSVRTLRDTSPADPVCIHWRHVAGELCLDVFSVVSGEGKAMGLARARGEKVVRRFADDAGVKVSYIGPDLKLAAEAWCLHERMLHHPYLTTAK